MLLDSITPALKQGTYAVKGQLVNDSGEAIPHTPLYLSNRGGTMLAMVSTDASGYFEFENRSENEELFALVESSKASFFGSARYELKDFRIVYPDSLEQTQVAQQGERQHILEVYFDFDSDALRPVTEEKLTRWIMENKQQRPDVLPFSIAGHTDQQGTTTYNQKLSERRAAAVAAFVEKQTGKTNQWHIRGFGKTLPKYTSDSLNRRVELQLIEYHAGSK